MPSLELEGLAGRGAAILLLFTLDLIFGIGVFAIYHYNMPDDLRQASMTMFAGWNGALGLALSSRSTPSNGNGNGNGHGNGNESSGSPNPPKQDTDTTGIARAPDPTLANKV